MSGKPVISEFVYSTDVTVNIRSLPIRIRFLNHFLKTGFVRGGYEQEYVNKYLNITLRPPLEFKTFRPIACLFILIRFFKGRNSYKYPID